MFHLSLEGERRRNLIRETQHDAHVREDYDLLRHLGIAVAREGIPWPLVDRGGEYDFACIDPMIEAMNRAQVLPIWDLCHYGYPDDLDPFSDSFVERFARYCRAAAEYVIPRTPGPHFFTPINEITFFLLWRRVGVGRTVPNEQTGPPRLRLALCARRPSLA